MFDVSIEAGKLSQAFRPIQILSEDAIIEVHDDYIEVPAVDGAKAASAIVNLSEDSFDEYNVSRQTIGIDLNELEKVFKFSEEDMVLDLWLDTDINALYIRSGSQEHRIGLVPTESIDEVPRQLSVEFSSRIQMKATEFSQAITAADMFSDQIRFFTEEGTRLTVEGKGDTNRTRRAISEEDAELLNIITIDSTFESRYLVDLDTCIPSESIVQMYLDEQSPMRLQYDLAEGDGQVDYRLAPKIKND